MMKLKNRPDFLLLIFMIFLVGSAAAVETKIKGGRMELKKKGEIIVFTGGVKLIRGGDTLDAKTMETTKARDNVKARGNVKLFRRISSTQTIRGYGHRGFYNTKSGKGNLVGKFKRAKVVYEIIDSTQTQKVEILAKKFDFFKDKSKAIARQNVYGITKDEESGEIYEFWSDQAEYFADKKKIILTGEDKPRVMQHIGNEKKEIFGKTIIYYIDTKEFVSAGGAEAIFVEDKEKESGK